MAGISAGLSRLISSVSTISAPVAASPVACDFGLLSRGVSRAAPSPASDRHASYRAATGSAALPWATRRPPSVSPHDRPRSLGSGVQREVGRRVRRRSRSSPSRTSPSTSATATNSSGRSSSYGTPLGGDRDQAGRVSPARVPEREGYEAGPDDRLVRSPDGVAQIGQRGQGLPRARWSWRDGDTPSSANLLAKVGTLECSSMRRSSIPAISAKSASGSGSIAWLSTV